MLDWRRLQENRRFEFQSKWATKLLPSYLYNMTVVMELYFTIREARANFAYWWLYGIREGEIYSEFIFFSDETWF